jgi:hypothetical protein
MTHLLDLLVLLWFLGTLGLLRLQVQLIREDPSMMPGGGKWAVVARALLWPIVLVAAFAFLIMWGIEDL